MSEIHLFIIWKNALNKFDEIKEDIQKKFNIKDIIKVNWTEEKFSENMTRFYGQFLPKGSFKEEHVGIGEFLCIIVEDKSPQYSERNTSRGGEVVNVNMFDAKVLYRELTGGGHKIHATNNLEETKHNLYFLFKKDYDFYKKIEFDGNIKTFSKDLVGSNGWDNLDDFFYCINQFCNYIVMRNFECIPDEYTMEGHGDIDLLVENLDEIVYLTNANKVFLEDYRVHYSIEINNEIVLFDFRYLGDNYYPFEMQKKLLDTKTFERCFYRPNDDMYFYSLLYHALIHKQIFSKDYIDRLKKLTKNDFVELLIDKNPNICLKLWLEEYDYKITLPNDKSVFYNKIADDINNKIDIENTILDIVKNNSDFTDILHSTDNWAILYHLTPIRKNLLDWYDFDKDKTLLEIGGGCGAFSGMFAKKLKKVSVVELSKRRAEIIYNRHKEHENLEIFAGNLNDINFEDKFDYVTLIGVLEYAGKFTEGNNPFKTFLQNAKSYLKPNGKLLIAIENKFGLKYFAGAREDHTARFFDSIENYPNDKSVQTFGKDELNELIKSVGFKSTKFYYPMPDYKLPKAIFSEDYLPKVNDLFDIYSPNYDQDRYALFNEREAFKNIIKNNQFEFFANSFLVEACI